LRESAGDARDHTLPLHGWSLACREGLRAEHGIDAGEHFKPDIDR
jgi:hypothetical protein